MWSSAVLLVFLRLLAVQLVVAMQLVVMQLVTTQRRQRALTHGGGQALRARTTRPAGKRARPAWLVLNFRKFISTQSRRSEGRPLVS